MPSSKATDYVVEEIVGKRMNKTGRPSYLIKWKGNSSMLARTIARRSPFAGYSSDENTWEPESHVGNCHAMIEAFEAKEAQSKKPRGRPSKKSMGAGVPLSNGEQRKSRSRSRQSSYRQVKETPSSDNEMLTDDEDDEDYVQKSTKLPSPRRSQKLSRHSVDRRSIEANETDAIYSAKLQQILAVRRSKQKATVEYQVQLKKLKKSLWIPSDQLTEEYAREVIEFLEERYVWISIEWIVYIFSSLTLSLSCVY